MKASEIRFVNDNQESGRVFIHLVNGKTAVRKMTGAEIRNFHAIRNKCGIGAMNEEVARLFNEKYSEPQSIPVRKVSFDEERHAELQMKKGICALDIEEETEYIELNKKLYGFDL